MKSDFTTVDLANITSGQQLSVNANINLEFEVSQVSFQEFISSVFLPPKENVNFEVSTLSS